MRQRCSQRWEVDALYDRLAEAGLDYGPRFRAILELGAGVDEVLVRVRAASDGSRYADAYRAHPTVLDAGLQALAAAAGSRQLLGEGRRFLPARIASVTSFAPATGELLAHCRLTRVTAGSFTGEVHLLTPDGKPVVSLRGVECTLLASHSAATSACKDLLLEAAWVAEAGGAAVDGPAALPCRALVIAPAAAAARVAPLLTHAGAAAVRVAAPADDFAPLLGDGEGFDRVVWVGEPVQGEEAGRAAIAGTDGFLRLLRVLAGQGGAAPFVLVLTRGVHRLADDSTAPDVSASPLWGLARAARLEQPGLRLRTVDLEAGNGFEAVAEELRLVSDPEDEVAWRGGVRYLRRIRRTTATLASAHWPPLRQAADKAGFALKSETPGDLDSLRLRRIERRAPGVGEIEVEVRNAPINFKDVMKSLGMLSSRVLTPTFFGEELGMECAGIVARVGEGVCDFQPGDRVALSYQGSFRSHVTTNTTYVVRLPDSMNLEEGSGLITPMLAAWYALVDRARLRRGDRLLIHSATGGAGLSAIQIARWIGAEIYATAGTPERREYLRSLGIRYVSDSRSLAFYDDIMCWTAGEGIDAVLNTLAGEGLFKGLKLLRPYGKFIEFGKRDIDQNTPLGLAPFNDNLDLIAVDFDRLRAERPEECRRVMLDVWRCLEAGHLKPLPSSAYPVSRAAEAFSHIARSQHIGKVVLNFDDPAVLVHPPLPDGRPPELRGTWLIAGGLTGLGLAVAGWAAERGVRHLVLAGRRGANTPEAEKGLRELREMGVEVHAVAADIADPEQACALVDVAALGLPPLRGVVHSAAVLHDAMIPATDSDELRKVLDPKIAGAWNLHQATAHLDLDHFVLFSSVSSLLGNAGQASYAAGNAFLDGLAAHRRAAGLPALTINWGVLGDTGMVARAAGLRDQLERIGMRALGNRQVFAVLDYLLRLDPVQVGAIDADWNRWMTVNPRAAQQPVFSELVAQAGEGESGAEGDLPTTLAALPAEARIPFLAERIQKVVAATMKLPPERVELAEPIRNLGLDSLMAVELTVALEARLGLPIPSMELMSGPSVLKLAEKVAARCVAAAPQEVLQ